MPVLSRNVKSHCCFPLTHVIFSSAMRMSAPDKDHSFSPGLKMRRKMEQSHS